MKKLLFALALIPFLASCGDDDVPTPSKPVNDGSKGVTACTDDHHPHAIDLGLPSGTKWSCCNLDAQTPTAFGGYYSYGEVAEKQTYTWGTYKYYDKSDPYHPKYTVLGEIAGTENDAAHVRWGGKWMMPTKEQMEELNKYCKVEYDYFDKTYTFTGPNGSKIVIPCAGYKISEFIPDTQIYETHIRNASQQFLLWASTQAEAPNEDYAVYYYNDKTTPRVGSYYTMTGLNIRPVAK